MKTPTHTSFEYISHALQSIHFRLERDGHSCLMVAAPTMATMQKRYLPGHVSMTLNKGRGKRVMVRRASGIKGGRHEIARYPNGGMSEYTIPVLACVINGQADLRAGNYFLHCQTGDIVLFPAGIPKDNGGYSHFTGDVKGRSCSILWITKSVITTGLRCYICKSQGNEHLPRVLGQEFLVPNLFQGQLFEEFDDELQEHGPSNLSVEMLSLIISLLQRDVSEGAAQPLPYSMPVAHESEEGNSHPIERASRYIDTHLKLHLTIATVARQVYLSPTQFTQEFRNYTGQSFHEYLTERRMEKTVQLLQETNMKVQEICIYVGIRPNQLRNLFQEKYQCSPMEFRRRTVSNQ